MTRLESGRRFATLQKEYKFTSETKTAYDRFVKTRDRYLEDPNDAMALYNMQIAYQRLVEDLKVENSSGSLPFSIMMDEINKLRTRQ